MRTWIYGFTLLGLFNLSACQTTPLQPTQASEPRLAHAYDFQIFDAHTQRLNVTQLAQTISTADVIFIGEYHGNHASHLLETELLAELYQLRPQQTLSMEMFNRDQQAMLNRYLDSEIGEKYLINEAPAWPNYQASYRPSVEFAKQHFIPVIAANASADIVRCIGQYGSGYIDLLPKEQRTFIAEDAFLDDAAYKAKFMNFLDEMNRHFDDERKQSSYAAQLARDNTMAESILKSLQEHPENQVIHLNGSFHSEEHLGTVALLKQRNPNLKIVVITPIRSDEQGLIQHSEEQTKLGDYVYFVMPQPEEFVDATYKRKARQTMFERSKEKAQQCIMPKT